MFNLENMNTMAKTLEELYKVEVQIERVFPRARDAIFQTVSEGKIAVSEKDDGKHSIVMGCIVKEADLIQHGIWNVTLTSGEKFRCNVLTHINKQL